jgi:uncharacterized protein YodC (DUF2158 family)
MAARQKAKVESPRAAGSTEGGRAVAPKLKVADRVRLISGGPVMTVYSRPAFPDLRELGFNETAASWVCKWFVQGALRSDEFIEAVLEVVDGKDATDTKFALSTMSDADLDAEIARLQGQSRPRRR